jgi:hypothetical protein
MSSVKALIAFVRAWISIPKLYIKLEHDFSFHFNPIHYYVIIVKLHNWRHHGYVNKSLIEKLTLSISYFCFKSPGASALQSALAGQIEYSVSFLIILATPFIASFPRYWYLLFHILLSSLLRCVYNTPFCILRNFLGNIFLRLWYVILKTLFIVLLGAGYIVVGWSNMLQSGRSRFLVRMKLMNFIHFT